jgi:hypothetical protein
VPRRTPTRRSRASMRRPARRHVRAGRLRDSRCPMRRRTSSGWRRATAKAYVSVVQNRDTRVAFVARAARERLARPRVRRGRHRGRSTTTAHSNFHPLVADGHAGAGVRALPTTTARRAKIVALRCERGARSVVRARRRRLPRQRTIATLTGAGDLAMAATVALLATATWTRRGPSRAGFALHRLAPTAASRRRVGGKAVVYYNAGLDHYFLTRTGRAGAARQRRHQRMAADGHSFGVRDVARSRCRPDAGVPLLRADRRRTSTRTSSRRRRTSARRWRRSSPRAGSSRPTPRSTCIPAGLATGSARAAASASSARSTTARRQPLLRRAAQRAGRLDLRRLRSAGAPTAFCAPLI